MSYSTFALAADLSRAMVVSNRALTSDAVERDTNFYLRDSEGRLRLAFSAAGEAMYDSFNALTGGIESATYAATDDLQHFAVSSTAAVTPNATPNVQNLYQWDGGALRLASALPDGTAATSILPFNLAEQHLYSADGRRLTMLLATDTVVSTYQRLDAERTILIGRSHRSGDDPAAPVATTRQVWSSSDGRSVTFADAQGGALTDQTPAGGLQRIYRWHADGDRLDDLLVGVVPAGAPTAVQDISRVSADDRYVWFQSSAALRPEAQDGASNLFVLDTTTSRLSFVASNVTATSFNRAGTRVAASSGSALLTFDAAAPSDGTACITCGVPTATSPTGIGSPGFLPRLIAGALPHLVTDDGRVFFDSPDRLVPTDVNGVSDVYEYQPGGGVTLISDGAAELPATVVEVSADGRDVFFYTRQRLVRQDTDGLIDLYDARVGGGLAAQQAPAAETPCRGDACRGTAPPSVDTSAAVPPSPAQSPTPRFALLRPSASVREAAARSGRLRVRVRTTVAGTVSVRASGRVRGRVRSLATGVGRLSRGGTATVTLRLSTAARRKLRRTGRLRIDVSATFSEVSGRQSLSFTLQRRAQRNQGAGR